MLGESQTRLDGNTAFTASSEQVFRSIQNFDCTSLFADLRKMDHQTREDILSRAFTGRDQIFTNGEQFGSAIARLLGIAWVDFQRRSDIDQIESAARKTQERLGIPHVPVHMVRLNKKQAVKFADTYSGDEDWRCAWGKERDSARDLLVKSERYFPWHVARNAGEQVVSMPTMGGISLKTRQRAGSYLQWVVLQDLLAQSNPFEGLMDIYGQGAYPLGQNKKEFTVIVVSGK